MLLSASFGGSMLLGSPTLISVGESAQLLYNLRPLCGSDGDEPGHRHTRQRPRRVKKADVAAGIFRCSVWYLWDIRARISTSMAHLECPFPTPNTKAVGAICSANIQGPAPTCARYEYHTAVPRGFGSPMAAFHWSRHDRDRRSVCSSTAGNQHGMITDSLLDASQRDVGGRSAMRCVGQRAATGNDCSTHRTQKPEQLHLAVVKENSREIEGICRCPRTT